MPVVAVVDGVEIRVYPNDHDPPHFHAILAEYHIRIAIVSGEIMSGNLPKAKIQKVKTWLERNQSELMFAWNELHNSRSYKGKIQ